MPYRRYPGRYRRYPVPASDTHIHSDPMAEQGRSAAEVQSIPLPNEPEIPEAPDSGMRGERRHNGLSGVFDIFKQFQKHIGLEELILLGLIFVLLQEEIEDEFLLIMLIYILIG